MPAAAKWLLPQTGGGWEGVNLTPHTFAYAVLVIMANTISVDSIVLAHAPVNTHVIALLFRMTDCGSLFIGI